MHRHSPRRTSLLPAIASLGILFALAFGLIGDYWLTDLLAHFRVHLAFLLLIPAAALLFQRHALRGITLVIGAVCVAAVTLSFTTPSTPAAERPSYKALHLNLHTQNTNFNAVLALLDSEDPDFVTFSEYTNFWDDALSSELAERYSHRLIEPRRDLGGLVLLSRYPIKSRDAITVPGTPRPIIQAELQLPEGPLMVLVIHAESPMSPDRFASRNLTINHTAALARANEGRAVIALGDFNCTPWSRNFTVLKERGGLLRQSLHWRMKATWPAWLGTAGIPIDHILTSPELLPLDYRVLPKVGSDHLPIVCEFVFKDVR